MSRANNPHKACRRGGLIGPLLAIFFGLASGAGLAAPYWQVQQPGVTAVVEGSQDTAKDVAATILRLQSAARGLLAWPDEYREPPVLVFVVNEALLRRTFQFPPDPPGAYTDFTARHGAWGRTPALTVVAAPMGYERGRELRSLQRTYGEALLDGEPTRDWPLCAKNGMVTVFTAAELTPPNHFRLPGRRVLGSGNVWNPQDMLNPSGQAVAQWHADEIGFSCYMLSFMIVSAPHEERVALGRMLSAAGRGTPLDAAATSELHEDLPEFTAHFREFARRMQMSGEFHDFLTDFPEPIAPAPEPTPVTADQIKVLMGKLCTKLQSCRK